jgi:hypothetical protein
VAEPTAPAGVLCVYTRFEERDNVSGSLEAKSSEGPELFEEFGPVGADLTAVALEGDLLVAGELSEFEALGTWAVTAATP